MVKIRLAMNKGKGSYSIVAAESSKRRDGSYINKVGAYNPRLPSDNSNRLNIDLDQVVHFFNNGAQFTERVAKLVKTYSANKNYALPEKLQEKLTDLTSFTVKA